MIEGKFSHPGIVRRSAGQRYDPDLLPTFCVADADGNVYEAGTGRAERPKLGTCRVTGKTLRQNPLTGETHEAECLEISIGEWVVPATRLSGNENYLICQAKWAKAARVCLPQ